MLVPKTQVGEIKVLQEYNKKPVTDTHENGDLGSSSETPLDDSASKLDDLHSLYHKNLIKLTVSTDKIVNQTVLNLGHWEDGDKDCSRSREAVCCLNERQVPQGFM